MIDITQVNKINTNQQTETKHTKKKTKQIDGSKKQMGNDF